MQLDREFNMLVGAPRAGKSTFAANYIKGYPENVIIVKHTANINDATFSFLTEKTPQSWRQGAAPTQPVKCKMAFKDRKKDYLKFLQWVLAGNFAHGLLVIDDASIFEKNVTSEDMEEIIAMRRHIGIDVLLVYHGLQKIPIDQFDYCNRLVLFNTVGEASYKLRKIPLFDEVEAAIKKAQHRYQTSQGAEKFKPEIVTLTEP